MPTFKDWLSAKGYVAKTIEQRVKDVEDYHRWLKKSSLTQSTYPVIMNYIGYLRGMKKGEVMITHSLKAIGDYLDYQEVDNPTRNIKIRRSPPAPPKLLTQESLDQVYECFQSMPLGHHQGYYHHSDQLILGLIIYQAMDVKDIYRLTQEDLDLVKGTVYIKGSYKGNSRLLHLQPQQILPLHHYQTQTRPMLMKKEPSTNYPGVDGNSDKLLIPQAEKLSRVIYQWRKLSVKVREQTVEKDYEVTRLQQLRQSCITHWIKVHGIRKAQYMAGFRTISGVERYQEAYLEDLQEQLLMFHPLR